MSDSMAALIAKRFIQRRDAKARQKPSGDYAPVADWNPDGTRGMLHPWKMSDLQDHLEKRQTYGHYLVDADDKTKLFAFDIDLLENKPERPGHPAFTGNYCQLPDLSSAAPDLTDEDYLRMIQVYTCNPRVDWTNRAHPARPWLKLQMRAIASKLASTIYNEFDIPVATAYSGSKGLHVYGFTGTISAHAAREAAEIALQIASGFEVANGNNFYRTVDQTPYSGFPNISIEVFPKQDHLKNSGGLGNLMRLPLGKNQKSSDPTFFLDERAPLGVMAPHPDQLALLENGNPWRD